MDVKLVLKYYMLSNSEIIKWIKFGGLSKFDRPINFFVLIGWEHTVCPDYQLIWKLEFQGKTVCMTA